MNDPMVNDISNGKMMRKLIGPKCTTMKTKSNKGSHCYNYKLKISRNICYLITLQYQNIIMLKINLFLANVPILYPLKIPENQMLKNRWPEMG